MQSVNRSQLAAFLTGTLGVVACFSTPARANLTIVPTFDSSITGNVNAVAMQAAVNAAIAQVEVAVLNPITVNITFKSVSSGLGASTTFINTLSYSQYHADLQNNQTLSTSDNSALATLPAGSANPVNGNTGVTLTLPLLRAIGESALGNNGGGADCTISLNTAIMNLARTGVQNPAHYDMQSVASHEIDEALGVGGPGSELGRATTDIGPLDLFRYTATGVRSYTTSSSATSYFSINGGVTNLSGFNQSSSGDYADWLSSATPQVQDAFGTPGSQPNLGNSEITALDVVGYNVVPVPEPVSCGILTFIAAGLLRRRRA